MKNAPWPDCTILSGNRSCCRFAGPEGGPSIWEAGSGALAVRLRNLGFDTLAVDRNREGYRADVPFVQLDLNHPEFSLQLGVRQFDLVTATEVIEHLESPIQFLRNVAQLLNPRGLAVVTTPNVDNLIARLKFLFTARLWMVNSHTPDHCQPIFYDLMTSHYLTKAGLNLAFHLTYPPRGLLPEDCLLRRRAWAKLASLAVGLRRGWSGNTHVFVAVPM